MECPKCSGEIEYSYEQRLDLTECALYNYIYHCRCGETSIDEIYAIQSEVHQVQPLEKAFGEWKLDN